MLPIAAISMSASGFLKMYAKSPPQASEHVIPEKVNIPSMPTTTPHHGNNAQTIRYRAARAAEVCVYQSVPASTMAWDSPTIKNNRSLS